MEESTTRPTAEPITAVIAERVRALREQSGMNQASLAEAMSKLGVPWKRATVVNLEKRASSSRGSGSGGRDAVTVQELLALALVFNMPPVLLLADPSEQDRIGDVPIARDLSGDHRGVLMWLVGVADAPGTRASRSDSELVHAGVTVMEALADMRVRRAAAQPPGLQRPVAARMTDPLVARLTEVLVAAQARYRKQKGFGAICTPPIPQPLIDQVATGLAPVIRELIHEAVRAELRKETK